MSMNSAIETLPPVQAKACCGKTAAPSLEAIRPAASWRTSLKTYRPLIVIFGMSMAIALLALIKHGATRSGFETAMQMSMGLFLTALATLKLFDVEGFAKSFMLYDPLAERLPGYGRIYPFLEVTCGLFLIAGLAVTAVYALLIPVLSLTAIGIVHRLRQGRKLTCGCTGSAMPIPLGRISVIENAVMVAMAAIMLVV